MTTVAQSTAAMAAAHLLPLGCRVADSRFRIPPKANENPRRFSRTAPDQLPPSQKWNRSSKKHTVAGRIQRDRSRDACFQDCHTDLMLSIKENSFFSKLILILYQKISLL